MPEVAVGGWIRPGVPERRWLDTASWVDVARGWVTEPEQARAALAELAQWRQARLWRYDHWVTEPRLAASLRPSAHPALLAAHKALRAAYAVAFDGPALALYRDGRDALGAHRDRELRYTENTLIAILTFGARRPWVLTPRDRRSGHPCVDLSPGPGDLLVLGGRAQRDWLHGVPPAPGLRSPRISVQWRWTSRTGRPETGPGYRAPRRFGPG
jgi:alkylated DNA repair dioxygenase AlkB